MVKPKCKTRICPGDLYNKKTGICYSCYERLKDNKKMKLKSKVKLTGSKKSGWIIGVCDNQGFKGDMAVTHEEIVILGKLIKRKIK